MHDHLTLIIISLRISQPFSTNDMNISSKLADEQGSLYFFSSAGAAAAAAAVNAAKCALHPPK
jgi:hypothetical protein